MHSGLTAFMDNHCIKHSKPFAIPITHNHQPNYTHLCHSAHPFGHHKIASVLGDYQKIWLPHLNQQRLKGISSEFLKNTKL